MSESQAAITEGAYWIEKYVGDLVQGGVTPIATVLRSVTMVKAKGQWTRLILDEEQQSNCFPRVVKASQVSRSRKYSEYKWNQVNVQD